MLSVVVISGDGDADGDSLSGLWGFFFDTSSLVVRVLLLVSLVVTVVVVVFFLGFLSSAAGVR